MATNAAKALVLDSIRTIKAGWPAQFKPTFVNGTWRKPEFSRRKIAMIRKATLLQGEEWPHDLPHLPRRLIIKGHKKDRLKLERLKTINENMKTMNDKIEEHQKQFKNKVQREEVTTNVYHFLIKPVVRTDKKGKKK